MKETGKCFLSCVRSLNCCNLVVVLGFHRAFTYSCMCLLHSGRRFCILHFIYCNSIRLIISTHNWVAGGIEGDCWSLSSKSCWTCRLPLLLGWSISKSSVAWASKHPVQLGNHGAHVWGMMEMKQLAQIKQEVLAGSFSLVLFCQLWAGGETHLKQGM